LEHRDALRRAVQAGLFEVFGSDHAPHTLEEKALPYPKSPSGMPGVQTMLSALLTLAHGGLMDTKALVRMACENPALLYGIENKGFLKVGFDADLVLVDPQKSAMFERHMVASKCGWSPYEGETFVGWPIHTFLRGNQIVADQALVGQPSGRVVEFDWK
jgi:dihydroorotase